MHLKAHYTLAFWLDCIAAITAIAAAIFWFWSASVTLPKMVAYYDSTPDNDPFYAAVRYSARMNTWAAGCSCASALSMGVNLLLISWRKLTRPLSIEG